RPTRHRPGPDDASSTWRETPRGSPPSRRPAHPPDRAPIQRERLKAHKRTPFLPGQPRRQGLIPKPAGAHGPQSSTPTSFVVCKSLAKRSSLLRCPPTTVLSTGPAPSSCSIARPSGRTVVVGLTRPKLPSNGTALRLTTHWTKCPVGILRFAGD